jgi:hypothetical protein
MNDLQAFVTSGKRCIKKFKEASDCVMPDLGTFVWTSAFKLTRSLAVLLSGKISTKHESILVGQ